MGEDQMEQGACVVDYTWTDNTGRIQQMRIPKHGQQDTGLFYLGY